MAVENFRFVSPGVQIHEIDNSVLPVVAPKVGPVVIGHAARGPIMQPFTVSSLAELEQVFGMPSNGNVGTTDVWRKGVPTSPTFATYAAQAYLKNNDPVTVVRLGGINDDDNVGFTPGWSIDNTAGDSGAWGLFLTSSDGLTGSLAAVIYASGSTPAVNGDGKLDAHKAFSLVVNNVTKSCTLDGIRASLNTNPTKLADSKYFLGESFEKLVSDELNVENSVAVLQKLSGDVKVAVAASPAETPWVVSQGTTPDQLFRFKGLEGGAADSKSFKIGIENIRPAEFPQQNAFGTFDVVVYKLFAGSDEEVEVESYIGVNLDKDSANYICRRIGTMKREWKGGLYVETGEYENVSKVIRVELSDAGVTDPSHLPYGFEIPQYKKIVVDNVLSCSFPALPLVDSLTVGSAKHTNFGLKTRDADNNLNSIVDITREKIDALEADSTTVYFSLGYVSASSNGTTLDYIQDAYNTAGIGGIIEGKKVRGFLVPFYKGFDGLDITSTESVVSNAKISDDDTTSHAYNIVNRALNIIAPAEFLEFNTLVVPGLRECASLQNKMINICKERGDSIAIIDVAGDYAYSYETQPTDGSLASVSQAIQYVKNNKFNSSYGAAYFPAVYVPAAGIYMPASIAALGAFGGNDARSAVWFAPAGFNRGGLSDGSSGLGVSKAAISLTAANRDDLYEMNINPIATFPGAGGVVIFGQKTLQRTPSALDRVNVRRLMNHIKKEVSRAAVNVIFEPNVKATWDNFKNVVNPFLAQIRAGYGLEDAKLVLDEKTTTADLVDRNTMYCKLYVKPAKAIEYVAVDLIVTNSGAVFAE